MRQETQDQLNLIMDTFSTDGVAYTQVRSLIDTMDHRAANGDTQAAGVLLVMKRFCNLIEVAKRLANEQHR